MLVKKNKVNEAINSPSVDITTNELNSLVHTDKSVLDFLKIALDEVSKLEKCLDIPDINPSKEQDECDKHLSKIKRHIEGAKDQLEVDIKRITKKLNS